jgi:hypothetical protein
MIVVTGDIERVAVFHLAGLAGKSIPHGWAFAVDESRALDLRCGGGEAPHKVFREVKRTRANSHLWHIDKKVLSEQFKVQA